MSCASGRYRRHQLFCIVVLCHCGDSLRVKNHPYAKTAGSLARLGIKPDQCCSRCVWVGELSAHPHLATPRSRREFMGHPGEVQKRFDPIHDYGRDWPSRYDLVQSQRAGLCTGRTGAGAVRRVQQQAGGDGYAEGAVRGVASAGVIGRRGLLGLGGDRTVSWISCVSPIGEDQTGTDDGTINLHCCCVCDVGIEP